MYDKNIRKNLQLTHSFLILLIASVHHYCSRITHSPVFCHRSSLVVPNRHKMARRHSDNASPLINLTIEGRPNGIMDMSCCKCGERQAPNRKGGEHLSSHLKCQSESLVNVHDRSVAHILDTYRLSQKLESIHYLLFCHHASTTLKSSSWTHNIIKFGGDDDLRDAAHPWNYGTKPRLTLFLNCSTLMVWKWRSRVRTVDRLQFYQ